MSRKSEKQDDAQSKENALGINEHLQEPLFLTAIAGFALTLLMFYTGGGFFIENAPIAFLALLVLSLYFLNAHLKAKTKNTLLYGIPAFLAVNTWFSYMMTKYPSSSIGRDYLMFTGVTSLFLLFYTLASHKLVKMTTALVIALFLSTLLTHFLPALDVYLAEIDPHWHYKWAQSITSEGHLPDYDYLTYPMKGGVRYYGRDIPNGYTFGLEDFYNATGNTYPAGLDMSSQRFLAALFMGSMHTVLKMVGFSIEDVAMLYPLVAGAFAIVTLYLLLRYLFEEMAPYNEVAGFLGAFMAFMSPVFATKAAAGNCEDDILGMLLLLSSFMFFVLAFRRRSLLYSLCGGVTLLMLAIAWGGYGYVILVLGLSMGMHAVTSFLKNEYCVRLPPYALVMYAVSKLDVWFLHRHNEIKTIPSFDTSFITLAFFGSIALSVILEYLRASKHGLISKQDGGLFGMIDGLVERNIKTLATGVAAITLAAVILLGPLSIADRFMEAIGGARIQSVIGKTIAEQSPLAGDPWSFIREGYFRYGIAFIYGLCMIPILLYLAFERNSFGSVFVLSWSLPMLWGVYNKSQMLFNSSIPTAALGATIGLYAVKNREELNGLRVIPTAMVLLTVVLYIPFVEGSVYANFIGVRTLYVLMTEEMHLWNPALQWLSNNTQPDEAVITWWDYGHWITSIPKRPVLIENLQADPYEIQDVARFFMLKRDQEDAMDTIRAYNRRYNELGMNLTHVAIDWTMIGKGSAMHFIATGVIENGTEGSGMNYAQCSFLEQQSKQQKLVTSKDGKMAVAKQLVFGCPWPIAGIVFEIVGEEINSIKVYAVDSSGSVFPIPWETWVKDNPASILGIHSLSEVLMIGMRFPDELGNTQYNWRDDNGVLHSMETYQLVYVPGEFNDYMMTRLYLGDHVDDTPSPECLLEENKNKVYCASYLNQGLFTGNLTEFKPKYFNLEGDFSGGYVKIYGINYSNTS